MSVELCDPHWNSQWK